ncbi:MAG: hypothetical protein RL648_402 [Verrucomicrobiota bacterium]
MAVDRLAEKYGVSWKTETRLSVHAATITIAGKPVLLIKPQTFMNLSGQAIGNICRFYKWPPQEVLVVVDEVQLPVGASKLSLKGSDGGHNGLKDIISRFGANFPRYRLGVEPLEKCLQPMTDVVLGKFTEAERNILAISWEKVLSEIERVVQLGPELAINTINQRIPKNEPAKETKLQTDRDSRHPGL